MQKKESFIYYLKKFNKLPKDSTENIAIAVARSYSCEMLEQTLAVIAAEQGLPCSITLGGYDQYQMEVLSESSFLYKKHYTAVVFLILLEDLSPDIVKNLYNHKGTTDSIVSSILEQIKTMLLQYRNKSSSPIFFCNFIYPYFAPNAEYHSQQNGLRTIIRKLNTGLADLLGGIQNAFILDLERVVYELGASNAYDRKMMHLARNPFDVSVYVGLAQQITNLLTSLRGKRKKCIVLDCDNTLWNGIIGEDGIDGIEITEDFQEMQRQLIHWKNTGILLAICSKNNEPDVREVFEKHLDIVLSLNDITASRINWIDKAENIRNIALELNIGLDSLIFIDDSEFECSLVREMLPMVEVIHLSGNPTEYAQTIINLPGLNFVTLTEEDAQRVSMYQAQKQREELRANQTDLQSYLASLKMQLLFAKVQSSTLARASQLTQKTNQFNLTTIRYTEEDLLRMEADGYLQIILRVSDRFGDSGWTGLLLIDTSTPHVWRIDVFLLSCRVMGRTIEQAFFAILLRLAKEQGIDEIIGTYIPTPKNKPVETLYHDLGFVWEKDFWRYNVNNTYEIPPYFQYELQL